MAGTAACLDDGQWATASWTWIVRTTATVNAQPELIRPFLSIPIPVARKRCPPVLHTLAEHVFDRTGQAQYLGAGERPSGLERMQAAAEQRLVRVYVPDSGDDPLIQNQGLDRSGASLQPSGQIVGIELIRQWLRAKF